MPNPQNLLPPMKPGETRNPNGRPKGSISISTHLKRLMQAKLKGQINPLTNEKEDMTVSEAIAAKLSIKAIKGDLRAMEIALDRLEGKAIQTVENINREVPVDEGEKMSLLGEIAKRKGITLEELIEKEGIDI